MWRISSDTVAFLVDQQGSRRVDLDLEHHRQHLQTVVISRKLLRQLEPTLLHTALSIKACNMMTQILEK